MSCSITAEEITEWKHNNQLRLKLIEQSLLKRKIEECNSRMFYDFKVKQAKEIMRTALNIFSGNLPVAFSGGKDSLVVLHIALEANPEVPVLYNNTTVEFPETLRYVRSLEKEWNLNLYMTRCRTPFLAAVRERGWATHESRWCCKPYKEQPAFEFLISHGFEAEITGTTRTESIYRRSLSPIKMPKKEPHIIRVNPIYDWNYWEVWTYINLNNLPYNPLYNKGYRRIGCWCCPINGWTHYRRLKKTHPKLYSFLKNFKPEHPQVKKFEAKLESCAH